MNKLIYILLISFATRTSAFAQDKKYHGDGIDDALRFVPLGATFALKAVGVESASSWQRLVVNSAASVAISSGAAWGLKHAVSSRRPDGTDNNSFPSGHTTLAFAGATILYKEYQHTSKWIGIAGYGIATLTAADRVRRNRHHWHDVATGAAIGIGGTMIGYYLGDLITGDKSKYSISANSNEVALIIRLP